MQRVLGRPVSTLPSSQPSDQVIRTAVAAKCIITTSRSAAVCGGIAALARRWTNTAAADRCYPYTTAAAVDTCRLLSGRNQSATINVWRDAGSIHLTAAAAAASNDPLQHDSRNAAAIVATNYGLRTHLATADAVHYANGSHLSVQHGHRYEPSAACLAIGLRRASQLVTIDIIVAAVAVPPYYVKLHGQYDQGCSC